MNETISDLLNRLHQASQGDDAAYMLFLDSLGEDELRKLHQFGHTLSTLALLVLHYRDL